MLRKTRSQIWGPSYSAHLQPQALPRADVRWPLIYPPARAVDGRERLRRYRCRNSPRASRASTAYGASTAGFFSALSTVGRHYGRFLARGYHRSEKEAVIAARARARRHTPDFANLAQPAACNAVS